MNFSLALLAPLALLVPTLGSSVVHSEGSGPEVERDGPVSVADPLDPSEVPVSRQVRIEQRVIIRIAPIGMAARSPAFAAMAPQSDGPRVVERKVGRCVPVAGISAVQPEAGGTLLLYMRDQRLIAASLEKACSARDFYSGFYLERSKDGMLCTGRDRLHSRAGASCGLGKLRQIVAIED